MKEEIEIKHIIKPSVMEEGVWEIPIRRHHLSYSPILLPRNQFDFALAVGFGVSFHICELNDLKSDIFDQGRDSFRPTLTPQITSTSSSQAGGCFWLFLVTKVTSGTQLPRAHVFFPSSPSGRLQSIFQQPKCQTSRVTTTQKELFTGAGNLGALNERGKWVGKIASSGSFNITRAAEHKSHTRISSHTLLPWKQNMLFILDISFL